MAAKSTWVTTLKNTHFKSCADWTHAAYYFRILYVNVWYLLTYFKLIQFHCWIDRWCFIHALVEIMSVEWFFLFVASFLCFPCISSMLLMFLVLSDMEKKSCVFIKIFERFFLAYHHWSLVTTKEEWFAQLIVRTVDRPSDVFFHKIF